jgi:hypothetical protein
MDSQETNAWQVTKRIKKGAVRVRRVAQIGCAVAQVRVRRGSDRVRNGSDSSALACCKAGPSSNLARNHLKRPSTERKQ